MKRCLSISLSFLLSFTIFAQTADQTEGCATLKVVFSPPPGSTTFFWDLGENNATSIEENPEHNYNDPGVYEVTFSETQGGPVIGTLTINVYERPVIEIAADPASGCWPLAVDFTNNTIVDPNIPVSGWEWTFGDGTSSSSQNTSHTYTRYEQLYGLTRTDVGFAYLQCDRTVQ